MTLLVSFALTLACSTSQAQTGIPGVNTEKPKSISVVGNKIKSFSLLNIDGKQVGLDDYKDAKGFIIVFTCNHCPYAKLYTKRFNELNTKYKPLGFPLLAINPMDTLLYDTESFELMKKRAATDKFNFPYLADVTQSVSKSFGAVHTPQAYVIVREKSKWVIRYSGAIDDNAGHAEKADPYIANAVDELLQSKPVSREKTESLGCKIFYRKGKGQAIK